MPIKVPVVQTGLEQSIQQAAQKAGKSLKINMGPGAKSIESLSQPLGRLTGKADDFTKSMAAANARVLAFGASVGTIAAVTRGMKELVTTTIEVEKSLANINSILKQSESQLNSFKNNIFDIARNTEQSFANVAEAALELSRQGLKAEQVTKRLNDALILSRLSGMNAADSVSGLTAAINSFKSAGLTSAEVLNKISAAAASAAVSDRDLIEGIKRSGAVAVSTGVKFDELVGIISALQEKTARGGAVIGNSLKTIFVRIQDFDKLQSLQNLGVQVTDLEGKVLSSSKIIENLAPAFAKLGQGAQVNLADKLVGKFQIAPFLALLEDYNQEVSRSGEVTKTSFNAANEAYQRNAALNDTLSAAINKATLNLKELANTLGEIGVTDNLKSILGFFNSIVSNIQGVLDGEGIGSNLAKGLIKGISNIISGPGLALALAVVGKLLIDFGKFGAKSLSVFFGLNKAAERQAKLQGQIASSLINDKSIRKKILDIEKLSVSTEEKKVLQAKFFTTALNEQLAVMTKMQGIAANIAPSVMAGTRTGRGRGRGRRAADGFLPVGAEKSDISRGVGGAPASAKPVVIPNFAFGGGKRGTMVANSSEYIVPNYANGGDAIFNQNMASSMGLPANAKRVRAASGYIPNFASIQDIIRRPGNYMKADGTFKSNKAAESFRNASQADKDKINQFRNRNQGSKTLIVPADRYGVASLFSSKKTGDSKTSPSLLSSPLAKSAAKAGITDIQFKGIQVRSLHSDNLKDKKTKFKNQIADLFINPVATLGANILGTSFQGNDAKELNNKLKKIKNQGGGANLFSSSVEGGIFESAIRLITKKASGLRAFKDEKDDQKPFDFEEGAGRPSKAFKNTFKFTPSLQKSDGKRTASNEAVRTVIGKAFNDPSQRDFLISQIKKVIPKFRAATGYIPNFAGGALEEAVGREKAAGLPVSQIRINQSGKLRNSKNPMGLAVTNTRDEPTGAIPNFALSDKQIAAGFGGKAAKDSLLASQKASEEAAKATRKTTQSLKKTGMSADGLSMKFIAMQMGLSLFGSSISEASKDAKGLTKGFADLSEGAMSALMVFMTMQMMGVNPGLRLGGKSKGAAAFAKKSQNFAAGGGGRISTAVAATPLLGKSVGKLGSGLAKLAGGFMRFLPVVGTAVTAFTLLNPLLKGFGVDIIGSIGKSLGFIKTPAEKASEALDKLAEKASQDIFSGGEGNVNMLGSMAAMMLQASKEGKTVEEIQNRSPEEAAKKRIDDIVGQFSGEKQDVEILRNRRGKRVGAKKLDSFGGTKIDDMDEFRKAEKNVQKQIVISVLSSLDSKEKLSLGGKTNQEIQFLVTDKLEKALKGADEEKLNNQMEARLKNAPDKPFTEGGAQGMSGNQLREQLSKYLADYMPSKQFRRFELGAAVNMAKEDSPDAQKKAADQLGSMGRTLSKALGDEQLRQEEKLKSGELTKGQVAKAQLKNTIALAKQETLRTNQLDLQIDKAKALGSLTKLELMGLTDAKERKSLSNKFDDKRLSILDAEIDKLKQLNVDTATLEGIKQSMLGVARNGLLTDDAAVGFASRLNQLAGETGQLGEVDEKLLREKLKALSESETLQKGELNAKQLQRIEDEISLQNLERKNQLISNSISLQNMADRNQAAAMKLKNKQEGDALGLIAHTAVNVGAANQAQAIQRAESRRQEELSPAAVALRKQSTFSAAGSDLLGKLSEQQLSAFQRKELSGKAAGITDEEGFKQFTNDLKSSIRIFAPDFAKSRDNINKISEQVLKNFKQTEEATKDNLDNEVEIAKLTRATLFSVQLRLKRLREPELINDARMQAMAVAQSESMDLEGMGLSREAARRKRDSDFIGDRPGLPPEQAIRAGMMARTYQNRLDDMKKDPKVINDEFLNKMASTSLTFRDGIVSAFAEGIKGAEDLENALLNAANTFLQSMTQNFVQKFMDQAANESTKGGILGFLGFSEGGKVNGGSGSRDDVPAMLMGGEYVMNKKAVSKYGTGFMSALNSGSIQGFARGGQVRDKEGMFMTPGVNGAGAIRGGANLMSFATQTPLAMGRDDLRGYGAFLGSESARMTGFGRRNNPAFQKVQSAKLQAFQLAGQEIAARQQASDQKVSLGSMLASAAISTLVGYGATQLGSTMGLGSGMSKLIGSSAGNYAGMVTTGAPSSGGAFGAAATESGAFTNLLSSKVDLSEIEGANLNVITKSAATRSKSAATMPLARPSSDAIMTIDGIKHNLGDLFDEDGDLTGSYPMIPKRATGGLIPAAGGVDTVPAMLSGGEFVMNAAATQNIGASNLQALNSGTGVSDNSDLVLKLDELIRATEDSQTAGNISITVNGSNGSESSVGGQGASEEQRNLSEKIKSAVKQVIADEKRLGGQLRR
jgi:TP901 family phage tail tape measure protein